MKTIEEAAMDHVKSANGFVSKDISFKEGAEFAQRWIPVDEELPESESEGSIFSSYLLLKIKDIEFPVVGYFTISRDDSFFELMDTSIKDGVDEVMVTHWRPIELK